MVSPRVGILKTVEKLLNSSRRSYPRRTVTQPESARR